MTTQLLQTGKKLCASVTILMLLDFGYLTASQSRLIVATEDGEQLLYRIHLIKDTLLLHEHLWVDIWVKSVSEKQVTSSFTPLIGWTIKDDREKEYPSLVHVHPLSVKINPGDSLGGRAGLGWGYGSSLPEGNYVLSYWLFGDSVSPLTFSVVKPQGEEAEALEFYLKSYRVMSFVDEVKLPREDFKKLHKDRTTDLIKFVSRFPKSIYAPQALSSAASSAGSVTGDKELAFQLNLRLLEEYSDPFLRGFEFVKFYYKAKKDPNGYRLELEKIIKTHPDSTLVARAKRALNELEVEE